MEAIRDELARLAADGLTPEEIRSGKNQLEGQVTLSLESVTSRMYRAAGVELYGEPFRSAGRGAGGNRLDQRGRCTRRVQ